MLRSQELTKYVRELNARPKKDLCTVFDLIKEFLQNAGQNQMVIEVSFFFFTLSVIYFFLFYYFFMCICTYILTGSKKTVKIFTVITESFMLQDNSSSWFTQST